MFSPFFIHHHSLADLRTTQVHECVCVYVWVHAVLDCGAHDRTQRRFIECSALLHSPKKDKKENELEGKLKYWNAEGGKDEKSNSEEDFHLRGGHMTWEA